METAGFLGGAVQQWASWMGAMSWQVALVAVLAWLLAVLFRRGPAGLRYFLWILVLAKLVLPPTLAVPWSAGSAMAKLPFRLETRALPVHEAALDGSPSSLTESPAAPEAARSADAPRPGVSPGPLQEPGLVTPLGILMGLWAAVAAVLFCVLGLQCRLYTRRALRDLTEPPEEVKELFQAQLSALGIRRRVALKMSPNVTIPGVLRAWRPVILLPENWHTELDSAELAAILAHELAHIKRGDLLMGWAAAALTCLYWFHPIVWLVNLKLRREREMACDDMVLSSTNRPGKEYASTLLRVAESFRGTVPAGAGLMGLFEVSDNLLQRVRSIGDGPRARRLGWGALVPLLVLCLCLPMAPWSVAAEADVVVRQDGAASTAAADVPSEPSLPQYNALFAPEPVPAAATPAPPRAPLGVALLGFTPIGSHEGLGEASAQMSELLAEGLSQGASVRLVERDKLDKAMSELSLSQTGLVDASTATEVGRLVGARVFVAGKLMRIGPEYVASVRLIDTQTSEISALRVAKKESDGILALADATAAEVQNRLRTFTKSRSAGSASSPFDAAIAQLRGELAGQKLPIVVVRVPESHIGSWVPDPAGENELMAVLSRLGFRVVDVSTFMKRESSSWWLRIFHGPAVEREGTEITVRQGFRRASDLMHDGRLNKIKEKAHIFIMGEAFSERAGTAHGFISCKARIEVTAIDTHTEEIAVAASKHAAGADTAEFIAGKKALRNAGGQLGLDLGRKLAAYWQKTQKKSE